jgi:hypothetical protein
MYESGLTNGVCHIENTSVGSTEIGLFGAQAVQ